MFDYPVPPLRLSVLSTKVHAVFDYLTSPALIGAPWLAGFADEPPAKWVMVATGIAVLVLALVTDYEGGLFKKMVMILHLVFDRLIGILLAASPWLVDFASRIYWPHLVLGLLLLLIGSITAWQPAHKKTMRAR